MAKTSKAMTESELTAVIDAQIRNAAGYMSGELSEQRRKALDYYLSEPFGNEVDGRSQVVSSDVQDVIEWILPDLIDMFAASDEAVRFEPVSAEDEAAAQQETDYINHVFYQKNNGFLTLYTWVKDALLQKNGYVKSFWEVTEKKTQESYENLSDEQFFMLMQNEDLELKQHTENEIIAQTEQGEQAVKTHDAVFIRTKKKGQARVVAVPPEEIGIIRSHNSIMLDDVAFMYQRSDKTVSELLEMGYDRKLVESIPTASPMDTEEKQARNNLNDEQDFRPDNLDKSMRRVTVYECYCYVDYDQDGIAELRKVTKAGNVILDNEPIDSIPFHAITPNILTHKHFGLSIADAIMDLQLIKSTIWRQMLDNMYYINNARTIVNQNLVEIDDLLVSRPGGIIRTDGNPMEAIAPFPVQPIGQSAFPLIEYVDKVREGRTGVSSMTTGLDPNVLNNNKGDASMQRMMTAAQKRVALIGRVLAETGVKSLFRHLHELICKHQDKADVVKLRNQWVEVNPTEWRERDAMTVHVGLGTGDRDKLTNALMGIMNIQEKIVASNGLDVLVSKKNLYKAAIDFAKFAGLKQPDLYFQDPDSPEAKQTEEQRTKQAQIAMENDPNNKLIAIQEQTVQLERQRLAADYENKIAEMREKYDKRVDDLAVKITELELKYQTNVPGGLV
jgi:hypothetical protein